MEEKIRIGLVGYGYWGPNIAKNLLKNNEIKFVSVFDQSEKALKKAKETYPFISVESNITSENIQNIDAFIIATPIETHYETAKLLLENDKHVLIQKPMAHKSDLCEELTQIADSKNKTLMVAHTFIFTPSIQKIKKDIEDKKYGNLNYLTSTRINLGLFQRSHNVVWDLAPHDFSIINFLINKKPLFISATGSHHTSSKLVDFANITIGYDDNFIATINLNWLSPIKIRHIIIGGDKKMVVYNDCSEEKVKIYDSGIEATDEAHRFSYRKGDIYIPELNNQEAIYLECEEFIKCIKFKKQTVSDGFFGKRIVQMIEATCKSIESNGSPIKV